MTFLNPLDALIPKIQFSFFANFGVQVTSEAPGSVSVGYWGSCQLSPFWGRGRSSQGALSTPPPSIASPVAQNKVHFHYVSQTFFAKGAWGCFSALDKLFLHVLLVVLMSRSPTPHTQRLTRHHPGGSGVGPAPGAPLGLQALCTHNCFTTTATRPFSFALF